MRLKNVKNAKEKIQSSPYIIENPLNYNGKYKQLFKNQNPIHIEIGMGKGKFIIDMAKANPQINFIGIEKFDSVIVRALEKLENIQLPNLRLIRIDANCIDEIFSKEIDTIYLNFSDPWPKKRHEHRRLTSDIFLNKYETVFAKEKKIVMKTDNRKLFEFSLVKFTNNGYKINDVSLNLNEDVILDDLKNIKTEYEDKFLLKGYNIYMVSVNK